MINRLDGWGQEATVAWHPQTWYSSEVSGLHNSGGLNVEFLLPTNILSLIHRNDTALTIYNPSSEQNLYTINEASDLGPSKIANQTCIIDVKSLDHDLGDEYSNYLMQKSKME